MEAVAERKKELTSRQQEIYEFIKQEVLKYRPPTVREIAAQFGIRSSNGVMCHLKAIENRGWITRNKLDARGIRLSEDALTQHVTLVPGQSFRIGNITGTCVLAKDQTAMLKIEAPSYLGRAHVNLEDDE